MKKRKNVPEQDAGVGGKMSVEEDPDVKRFALDKGPGRADEAGEEQVPGRRAWS